jgi:Ca2+/Na+ antiporter
VSSVVALALLVGGVVLLVAGAELFFEGLLAAAARHPAGRGREPGHPGLPARLARKLGRAAGALLLVVYVGYVTAAVIVALS